MIDSKALEELEKDLDSLVPEAKRYVYGSLDGFFRDLKGKMVDLVYSKVVERTGMLGRSFVADKRTTEEGRISVDIYFDSTKAPHVNTHYGDYGFSLITPKNVSWLTIPVSVYNVYYNDVNHPRPRVSDFSNLTVIFKKGAPLWVVKDGKNISEVVFAGRKFVVIKQRIPMNEVSEFIQGRFNEFASRKLKEFILERCLR